MATLLYALAVCNAPAGPARWTADEWKADLEYLRVQIGSYHENPYHTQRPAALRAKLDSLREAIPTMTDFEIAFAMHRCVASLGDGHSWLNFEHGGLSRYFLFTAYEFSDGLYITRAGPGLEQIVGTRVTAVDGKAIDTVRAALAPYIARDNAMDLVRQVPFLVRQPPALHAAGISASPDSAVFSFVREGGAPFTKKLTSVSAAVYRDWFFEAKPEDSPFDQNDDVSYWYRALAEDNALYFRFNAFMDMPKQPFVEFLDELFALGDARELGCLIIDLRQNRGGRIMLIDPLMERLRAHPRWSEHLYVLTGRETYSAALMLAARLERQTDAIFAGEPGRGKPNSYGGYGGFTLPNTGLNGSLAYAFFNEGRVDESRDRLDVQISVPLAYDDFRRGRDQVLERVLEHWRASS